MAEGVYTTYDEASSNASGHLVYNGESAATAAAIDLYVGFEPARFTFYNIGTNSRTVPAGIYQWIKGMEGDYNLLVTASTGVVTATTTNEVTIELQTSGTYEGQYKITIPAALQTNSGWWTLIVER